MFDDGATFLRYEQITHFFISVKPGVMEQVKITFLSASCCTPRVHQSPSLWSNTNGVGNVVFKLKIYLSSKCAFFKHSNTIPLLVLVVLIAEISNVALACLRLEDLGS